jgi:hypothetical protein
MAVLCRLYLWRYSRHYPPFRIMSRTDPAAQYFLRHWTTRNQHSIDLFRQYLQGGLIYCEVLHRQANSSVANARRPSCRAYRAVCRVIT